MASTASCLSSTRFFHLLWIRVREVVRWGGQAQWDYSTCLFSEIFRYFIDLLRAKKRILARRSLSVTLNNFYSVYPRITSGSPRLLVQEFCCVVQGLYDLPRATWCLQARQSAEWTTTFASLVQGPADDCRSNFISFAVRVSKNTSGAYDWFKSKINSILPLARKEYWAHRHEKHQRPSERTSRRPTLFAPSSMALRSTQRNSILFNIISVMALRRNYHTTRAVGLPSNAINWVDSTIGPYAEFSVLSKGPDGWA